MRWVTALLLSVLVSAASAQPPVGTTVEITRVTGRVTTEAASSALAPLRELTCEEAVGTWDVLLRIGRNGRVTATHFPRGGAASTATGSCLLRVVPELVLPRGPGTVALRITFPAPSPAPPSGGDDTGLVLRPRVTVMSATGGLSLADAEAATAVDRMVLPSIYGECVRRLEPASTIVMEIEVAPDGHVVNERVVSGAAPLGACMAGALQRWTLPARATGSLIRVGVALAREPPGPRRLRTE